jgi:hypothetical protein
MRLDLVHLGAFLGRRRPVIPKTCKLARVAVKGHHEGIAMKKPSPAQEALVAALGHATPRDVERAEQLVQELAVRVLAAVERVFVREEYRQARAALARAVEAALVDASTPGFVPPRRHLPAEVAIPSRGEGLVSGMADLMDFFPDASERRAS